MHGLEPFITVRMPVVLARLRTDPQIDRNLCGINVKTACNEEVCRLDVLTINKTSP